MTMWRFTLCVVAVIGRLVSVVLSTVSPPQYAVGNNLVIDLSTRTLTLNNGSVSVLTGNLGYYISVQSYNVLFSTNELLQVSWDNDVVLTIQLNSDLSDSSDAVYNVLWTTSSMTELLDSFVLSPYHWYGGAEYPKDQGWVLDKLFHPMYPYVTGHASAMERYWLASSHVALTVADDVPLSVGINSYKNDLRFLSQYETTIYTNCVNESARPFLNYKLWVGVGDQGQTLKALHLNVVQKYYGLASGIPDNLMMTYPIWSTWARYKKLVNQSLVLEFANEIVSNNFKGCQIEIDDAWATHYGDMVFDPVKFPDAQQMIETLHNMGFRVTVWVHPFANLDSDTANNPAYLDYWVKSSNGSASLVSWWDGVGYILDATNPAAVQWFIQRLNIFKQQYGVDSFKFDAGETNWLSSDFRLFNATFPNHYSTEYTNLASQLGTIIEARSNTRNQAVPNFMRILDRDSNWGYDNGIKTVIPITLLFGMLNRPFVLPDMIGGNAYGPKPDRELYIRWTQANAFLPSMQFSITPWDYDDQCVEMVRSMVSLHEQYAGYLVNLAVNSTLDGSPIIRPLWWSGDESEQSLLCDSQILFGDDILVAPILDSNVTGRAVYFPEGSNWLSALDGNLYEGGTVVTQNVTLEQLPYYFRK